MYLRTLALIQYCWLDVVGKSGNIAEYSTTLVRDTNAFPKGKNMGLCYLLTGNSHSTTHQTACEIVVLTNTAANRIAYSDKCLPNNNSREVRKIQ